MATDGVKYEDLLVLSALAGVLEEPYKTFGDREKQTHGLLSAMIQNVRSESAADAGYGVVGLIDEEAMEVAAEAMKNPKILKGGSVLGWSDSLSEELKQLARALSDPAFVIILRSLMKAYQADNV